MLRLLDAHQTWLECRETNDSLENIVDSCSVAFGAYNDAISALRYQVHIEQAANQQKLQVIDTMHQVINSQKKQIHKLRVRKILDNIAEGILAGIIVWLVIR